MSKYNLSEILPESFDSLVKKIDKQKGKSKKDAEKIAGFIAKRKMAGAGKGPTKKQKARIKEDLPPIERQRLEGFIKRNYLESFKDSSLNIFRDLLQNPDVRYEYVSVVNIIIELFFYKHINTTKKLSYKVKEYYYSKLSNVKKFNLDYETFFLEFKDKLLSE